MSNLEFGKTLCLLKTILDEIENNVDPKLVAKGYELLKKNEKSANDYINYMTNYTMEKSSKKGAIPSPFDKWEDSKKYD